MSKRKDLGMVHLVIDPRAGLFRALLDEKRAHEIASITGCVVAAVPITADYRPKEEP